MMTYKIHYEDENLPLLPSILASELYQNGIVAFFSTTTHQRKIAQEIIELVSPNIEAIALETSSDNSCMCVIDTDRFEAHKILTIIGEIDNNNSINK